MILNAKDLLFSTMGLSSFMVLNFPAKVLIFLFLIANC